MNQKLDNKEKEKYFEIGVLSEKFKNVQMEISEIKTKSHQTDVKIDNMDSQIDEIKINNKETTTSLKFLSDGVDKNSKLQWFGSLGIIFTIIISMLVGTVFQNHRSKQTEIHVSSLAKKVSAVDSIRIELRYFMKDIKKQIPIGTNFNDTLPALTSNTTPIIKTQIKTNIIKLETPTYKKLCVTTNK